MATLDSSAFPHILDRVIELADFRSLLHFRRVSRYALNRADTRLCRHLVLSRIKDKDGSSIIALCLPTGEPFMPALFANDPPAENASYMRVFPHLDLLDVPGPQNDDQVSVISVCSPRYAAASECESRTVRIRQLRTEKLEASYMQGFVVTLVGNTGFHGKVSHPLAKNQITGYKFDDLSPLLDTTNVLYLPAGSFKSRAKDKIRKELVNRGQNPGFSLTMVYLEPVNPDEVLHEMCGVEFDPDAVEQVDIFKAMDNFTITTLDEYLNQNNLESVLLDFGLEGSGFSTAEEIKKGYTGLDSVRIAPNEL